MIDKSTKRLVKKPDDQKVVSQIKLLLIQQKSFKDIATIFNDEKVNNRLWTATYLRNIINRNDPEFLDNLKILDNYDDMHQAIDEIPQYFEEPPRKSRRL